MNLVAESIRVSFLTRIQGLEFPVSPIWTMESLLKSRETRANIRSSSRYVQSPLKVSTTLYPNSQRNSKPQQNSSRGRGAQRERQTCAEIAEISMHEPERDFVFRIRTRSRSKKGARCSRFVLSRFWGESSTLETAPVLPRRIEALERRALERKRERGSERPFFGGPILRTRSTCAHVGARRPGRTKTPGKTCLFPRFFPDFERCEGAHATANQTCGTFLDKQMKTIRT